MKKVAGFIFLVFHMIIFADYSFPFKDPQVATIVGSSTLMTEGVSTDINIKEYEININGNYKVPDVFWYQEGFKFSLVRQSEKKAPLIFLIAGTGASHNSLRMNYLQRIFYDAGYNVISISSPINMNFMINVSTNKMPGRVLDDSRDIYRVMQMAYEKVKNKIDVTDFYVVGYSLGATQAAYVSYVDEQEKKFNFKRTYMINPVVDLYKSALKLDDLLMDNIDDKKENIVKLINEVLGELRTQVDGNTSEINGEVIFSMFKNKVISDKKMQAIIGLDFRLASINLNFITDVLNKRRVYTDGEIGKFDPLFKYFERVDFASFEDYVNKLALPFYSEKGIEKNQILNELKIKNIENYLKNSNKIAMVTNADELILDKGDISYLKNVFGKKAIVYPYGGHCGNMFYEPNVRTMLNYLKNGVLVYEE